MLSRFLIVLAALALSPQLACCAPGAAGSLATLRSRLPDVVAEIRATCATAGDVVLDARAAGLITAEQMDTRLAETHAQCDRLGAAAALLDRAFSGAEGATQGPAPLDGGTDAGEAL